MTRYKFQFKTGHIYDGSTDLVVNDFIAEFEGKINPSLASAIEASGGQLVPEPTKPRAKKRNKVNPVKWPTDEAVTDDLVAAGGEVTDLLAKGGSTDEAGE